MFNIKAYSIHDPEVGYCQGSAFICGLLLIQVNIIHFVFVCKFKFKLNQSIFLIEHTRRGSFFYICTSNATIQFKRNLQAKYVSLGFVYVPVRLFGARVFARVA